MKFKPLYNIFLWICLLVIWGFVFKRLFYKPDISIVDDYTFNGSSQILDSRSFEKQEFEITYNKDPFLGKVNFKAEKDLTTNMSEIKKIAQKSKINNVETWPKISYHGFLKGNSSRSVLALIKINSKIYRVREGDEIEGVTIDRNYADSIQISRGKETKIIIMN